MKNNYISAIEKVVLDALNDVKDDEYIDKIVYLAYPLIS